MKGSEMFIARRPVPRPLSSLEAARACEPPARRYDAGAGPQLVVPVDDDALAGAEAASRSAPRPVRWQQLQRAHLDGGIRPDDEGVVAVRARIARRGSGTTGAAAEAEQQPGTDELAGPKPLVIVLKHRLEPDRAGALIDLVVDQLERPSPSLMRSS